MNMIMRTCPMSSIARTVLAAAHAILLLTPERPRATGSNRSPLRNRVNPADASGAPRLAVTFTALAFIPTPYLAPVLAASATLLVLVLVPPFAARFALALAALLLGPQAALPCASTLLNTDRCGARVRRVSRAFHLRRVSCAREGALVARRVATVGVVAIRVVAIGVATIGVATVEMATVEMATVRAVAVRAVAVRMVAVRVATVGVVAV